MKSFVTEEDGDAFQYLGSIFPRLRDAKIKEGIFVGSQMRKIMKDPTFPPILEGKEKAAWEAFKSVVRGFLDSKKKMRTPTKVI
ncbi:uncharacterized protein TNIN_182201 [Trichonephila inaurata madagascariensis]|uniref:Uncharacterized protein n=1 Tax=Trichonephila inaurata madagascariensis TaxID=2747483 RepID=A0A8X6Y2K9_9ARAC|nr:uncharacterized protein TNIN_182201 [Trichonephila inaurata madagascariensis]